MSRLEQALLLELRHRVWLRGYIDAALLGGLANLSRTVVTSKSEGKCRTRSQALWRVVSVVLVEGLVFISFEEKRTTKRAEADRSFRAR